SWHQLDRRHSGCGNMIELFDCGPEAPTARERSDVQLEKARFLPWASSPMLGAPRKLPVIDDLARSKHIVGLEVRGGIGDFQLSIDAVFVECARASAGHRELVPAVGLSLHRMRAVDQQIDTVGCRSP